ncbi:MAG TPA: hemerythrin domain-containing protein [Gillisia sp.]|nr:hemerythrin domain-containing protein [Gillisia sp.]
MSAITTKSRRKVTELEPILEEHHHALQFCSRIRDGLKKHIELQRIRAYTDWFLATYLEPHFEIEEKYIFPVIGSNLRVKRALANHRRIRKLLSCSCENEKVLNLLEEELTSHIRFEERVLFKEIKNSEKLAELQQQHQRIPFKEEDWEDKFWIPLK